MRIPRFRLSLVVLIASLALASPGLAQGFTFGLRPEDQSLGYFEYALKPGDRIEDAVLAVNGTDDPLRLVVTRVTGHTALTGGISFPGDAEGPGSWIELPDEGVVEVPSGLALRMPFTLRVPDGTPPGEYVAGFLSTPEDSADLQYSQPSGEGIHIDVIPQMGVSVIITVLAPDRCEVRVDSLQHETSQGEWKLVMGMTNVGNVHFRGTGEFRLHSPTSDEPVLQRTFDVGYFIAGEDIGYPLYFTSVPPAGEYVADISLSGTDCAFGTRFTETLTVSEAFAEAAAAEALRWDLAEQESGSSTNPFDWSIIVMALLGAAAVLILVLLVIVHMLLKDQHEEEQVDLLEQTKDFWSA